MNYLKKIFLGSTLAVLASSAFASPENLTTVNNSEHGKVYAKIGFYTSPEPVLPHQTRNRDWRSVQGLCGINGMPNQCSAEIIIENDKTHKRESLGSMSMDVSTGEISPGSLSSKHYNLVVTGTAHVTVTDKD
jgi:hypothetical protein